MFNIKAVIWSVFHLYDNIKVAPVGNQMERALPLETFRKKRNTFWGITFFPFLPEWPKKFCSICYNHWAGTFVQSTSSTVVQRTLEFTGWIGLKCLIRSNVHGRCWRCFSSNSESFPFNFLQGFVKTEDKVKHFLLRSPCFCLWPGFRGVIKTFKRKSCFPFRLCDEKIVLLHLLKNSYRKFHVNGKRPWRLRLCWPAGLARVARGFVGYKTPSVLPCRSF